MCFQHNTALCCNTRKLADKTQKPTDKKLDKMGGKGWGARGGDSGLFTAFHWGKQIQGVRKPPDSVRHAIKPRHRAPLDPRAAYCDHSRLSSSLRHNERRLFLIGHAWLSPAFEKACHGSHVSRVMEGGMEGGRWSEREREKERREHTNKREQTN